MNKTLLGTIIFTVIEIITMVFWLKFALDGRMVLSVVVLSVGLFLEHYVSVNVGAGRNAFHFPPDSNK